MSLNLVSDSIEETMSWDVGKDDSVIDSFKVIDYWWLIIGDWLLIITNNYYYWPVSLHVT